MLSIDKRKVFLILIPVLVAACLFSSLVWAAETPRYIVRAISVEGLKNVPEKTVLDQVTNTQIGKAFSEDDIRKDMQNIMGTGYFSDIEARLAPYENGIKVIIKVVEHIKIKSIQMQTPVLSPVVLRGYIRQKEGEVLNEKLLDEDLRSLEERIMDDHGYVVFPMEINISPEGDLEIVMEAVKIADITVSGHVKTKEHVIRREIQSKVGDYLNMDQLGDDLRRLIQTQYFEEVKPNFIDTDNPLAVVVDYEVVERKTASLAFGGGYSTADGLLGYIEFADANLRGLGKQISLRTEVAQKKVSYDFKFTEPYLFGTRASMDFALYNTTQNRDRLDDGKLVGEYIDRRQGGELALGWPLGKFTRASIGFNAENTSIEPLTDSLSPSTTKTRSLSLGTYTDTTDHPFYPLTGYRLSLGAESAFKFLGSETEFTKYTGWYSKYWKVGRADQVIAFRLVGGTTTGQLPWQEEYLVGGGESLRGYRYGALSGDRMAYLNTEYRFKISKGVQAAIFLDGGQAWHSAKGAPGPVKWGYGIGLRVETPLGIMRLDYGIGEKGGQTYFSLGPSF
ncbi:MAG TPA: BamA/TamA family outer membrane protein [Firmicutes bacterium]|nr:BamA/TamA family outer membrane protein [Bacillota bacterium]